MSHIILAGGTGTNAVGRALAAALHLPFVDCHERIALAAVKPLLQLFAEDGEDAVRTLEAHVLTSVLREESAVLAVGVDTLTLRRTSRCSNARERLSA